MRGRHPAVRACARMCLHVWLRPCVVLRVRCRRHGSISVMKQQTEQGSIRFPIQISAISLHGEIKYMLLHSVCPFITETHCVKAKLLTFIISATATNFHGFKTMLLSSHRMNTVYSRVPPPRVKTVSSTRIKPLTVRRFTNARRDYIQPRNVLKCYNLERSVLISRLPVFDVCNISA